MKVLIVSDNHSEKGIIYDVYSNNPGDLNIHLGDSEFNYDDSELSHFYRVKGNCDADQRFPVEEFDHASYIFLTHGHLYDIKLNRYQLAKRAAEYGAKYAVYGHSHIAEVEKIDDVYCINPGSISLPKGTWPASYCVLDTDEDSITFFSRDYEEIETYLLEDL